MDIETVLGQAKPAERIVGICLAGDLLAEFDRLQLALEAAEAAAPASPSLADRSAGVDIARQIEAVRDRIRESRVQFLLRGLSDRAFSDLLASHPSPDTDKLFDAASFTPALLAACAVDPAMTVEQAVKLLDTLSRGEARRLFDGAWVLCTGELDVPFSSRASALLQATGGK